MDVGAYRVSDWSIDYARLSLVVKSAFCESINSPWEKKNSGLSGWIWDYRLCALNKRVYWKAVVESGRLRGF